LAPDRVADPVGGSWGLPAPDQTRPQIWPWCFEEGGHAGPGTAKGSPCGMCGRARAADPLLVPPVNSTTRFPPRTPTLHCPHPRTPSSPQDPTLYPLSLSLHHPSFLAHTRTPDPAPEAGARCLASCLGRDRPPAKWSNGGQPARLHRYPRLSPASVRVCSDCIVLGQRPLASPLTVGRFLPWPATPDGPVTEGMRVWTDSV
jgi:hypothetical protein